MLLSLSRRASFTLLPIFTDYLPKIFRKPLLSWKIIKPIHSHTGIQFSTLRRFLINSTSLFCIRNIGILFDSITSMLCCKFTRFEFIWTSEHTCNDSRNTHEKQTFLWTFLETGSREHSIFCTYSKECFALCEFSLALFSIQSRSPFLFLSSALHFARPLLRFWRSFYEQA